MSRRTSTVVENLSLTLANTEYPLDLDRGLSELTVKLRGSYDFKYSFKSGDIALGTYLTIPSGSSKTWAELFMVNQTIYFACAEAGQVMEIEKVLE